MIRLPDAVVAVHDTLTDANIPHAVGGAMAGLRCAWEGVPLDLGGEREWTRLRPFEAMARRSPPEHSG
jgi:hypothetical protein